MGFVLMPWVVFIVRLCTGQVALFYRLLRLNIVYGREDGSGGVSDRQVPHLTCNWWNIQFYRNDTFLYMH